MISNSKAKRLKCWIDEAVDGGATLLCGGNLEDTMLEATLLENVGVNAKARNEEAFGPMALLNKFQTWGQAIDMVNDSKFGLQVSIMTRDLYKAQKAWDKMQVGGVIVGDVPSYRVDHMPYGGVKDSGLGREGIHFAMDDMTEIRALVIRGKHLR